MLIYWALNRRPSWGGGATDDRDSRKQARSDSTSRTSAPGRPHGCRGDEHITEGDSAAVAALLFALAVLTLVACAGGPGTTVAPPPAPAGDSGSPTLAVDSAQADKYVGKSATVEVKRAYCSYQAGTRGSPTFCNDARFGSHHFTMVVWGADRKAWNPAPESWDGKCFRVTGTVSTFRGKPQIEAKEPTQVKVC